MMAASMLGGRLAERIGVRLTCMGGALTALSGVIGLLLLSPESTPPHIVGALVLVGSGLGLANGPSQSAAMAGIERGMSGVASGVISISRYLGGVAGISVLALLLSAPSSGQSLAQHRYAILLFAAAFFLAALVSLLLPGRTRHAA